MPSASIICPNPFKLPNKMLNISKAAILIIYLLPFQKLLSHLVGMGFPAAKDVIFIAFEFVWVALFIPLGSISKKYWPIYLFVFIALLISIINIINSFGESNAVLSYLSGFRRLALPFVSFFIFNKLIQQKNGLNDLNKALINLYWLVLVLQAFDFAAMQFSDAYRSTMISLSNISGEITDDPLASHLIVFERLNIRSFGVLLNFHGSGLLLLFLFLYKLHLKGAPKLAEVAIMSLGVIAGGSLQNLGLLIFMPVLLLGAQHLVRYLLAIGLIIIAVIITPYLTSNPLPYFGTIYMFEYVGLSFYILLDMLSNPLYFSKLFLGFGNLRLTSGSWGEGTLELDLGDTGFFRLLLESGLLVFLFWLLLCIQLGKYKINSKQMDNLRHNSLFAIPFIGILSLTHYPVLFLPINMAIYMLSLALINELKANTVPFDQSRRNKSKSVGVRTLGQL